MAIALMTVPLGIFLGVMFENWCFDRLRERW